ncbi:type I-E CRISPR-associated protein Cse2/CasB [Streptomyces sp. NPDC088354]|uniref:type I-E CRISPR-associated protein Cse2/CasB n=1 Tax=Streptomyces sp. NPDC088354 TaxID=3365856 RepID=UPI0037FFB947
MNAPTHEHTDRHTNTHTSSPTTATTAAPAPEAIPPRDNDLARYDEFAERVRELCRVSPGVQSALRSGLGKPVTEVPARMHAALLRPGLIRENTESQGYADTERAYYAVAALIAARPRAQRLAEAPVVPAPRTDEDTAGTGTPAPAPENNDGAEPEVPDPETGTRFHPHGTSLGESFALAVGRRSPDELKSGAAESRLHLLVRQDLDGVHRMLPGVFRWLGSSGITPDYACLLRDLTAWRYRRDAVSTRWLQAFYRSLRRQEAAAEQQPTTPAT